MHRLLLLAPIFLLTGCWPLIPGPYEEGGTGTNTETEADTDTQTEADADVDADADADADADVDTGTPPTETTPTDTPDVPVFTPAYVAFSSGFGVDPSGDVVPVIDLSTGLPLDPYVLVRLFDANFADQCVMMYSFTDPSISSWDPKAFMGFEGAMNDMALSYSDCGKIQALGYAAELVFQQDYMLSLGKLDAGIADVIDAYPSYYFTSDQVVGGNFGTTLLSHSEPVSFIGFEVDAKMGTDLSAVMEPATIPKSGGVNAGYYLQNEFLLVGL